MFLHTAAIAALLHLPVSPWAALPEPDPESRQAMPAPSAVVAGREPTPFDGATLRVVVGGVVHEIDPLGSGAITMGPDGSMRLHGSVRLGTDDDRDGDDRVRASFAWSMVTGGIFTNFISFTIINESATPQDFGIVSGIAPPFVAGTYGGTITGVLTDLNADGATLTGSPTGFVYRAAIDGVEEFELLGPGYSTSAPPGGFALVGPAAFGTPIPDAPGPPMSGSSFIHIDFGLSPSDQAIVHGTFTSAR